MKFFTILCAVSAALANPMSKVPFINDGLIVGGVIAAAGDCPHQISLQKSSHFCGGAIIDKEWIMTAAHCVSGTSASVLKIRYGTLTHNAGGKIATVTKVISHEKYDSWTIDYDYALLKVTPLELDGSASKAIEVVAKGHDPKDGENVEVSGWGYLRESGGSLPTQLYKVDVPVVGRPSCNEKYGKNEITDRMFCAGIDAGGKDACQGDSGGPVVCQVNGQKQLCGVVSWGYGCARPTHPGVYSTLGAVRDWIDAQMKN